MQIIHRKEDFLYTLFPELTDGDDEQIISVLSNYYSYGGFKPLVRIENDVIIIELDTSTIARHEADYHRAVTLCEKGNYPEAKPLLAKLIAENPTRSEYHRILGQILSDEGDQNEAINCLIDALRWDSKNGWALLMMGNIFAKFKKDIPTAIKYYDQAVAANPTDHTAIYNIGALLFQQGNYTEAKKYLWEAQKINNTYPNTHHVLAMIAEQENDLHSAFYSIIQSLKLNSSKDTLYKNSLQLAFGIANKMLTDSSGKKMYREYRRKLELDGGKEIDLVEDTEIQTAAKCEFAETYKRPKHIVRFNSNYPAVAHLIMHELVHLDFVIEARKAGVNKLFTSNAAKRAEFMQRVEPTMQKLRKMKVPENEISTYCNGLFDGVNLQVYNAPIDLFIENFLYNEFPELRPYQFISLYNLLEVALRTVTEKDIVEITPKDILSKNKIYNIVNGLQFNDLYGIDLTADFKPTKAELNQAIQFYTEFLEYKDDRQPAEEYELLQHWANDLQLSEYFQLVDETEFHTENAAEKSMENLFEKINMHASESANDKETEMRRFLASQQANGTNADVVIYMVEALKYFENMNLEQIKAIAIAIAMQGAQGFDPFKQYAVDAIPNKTFSGFQILSYCYVSFALALPDVLMELKLPYHEEYLLARGMRNGKN
jgi:tetratricopeptide (TPR) repeat protein